MSYRALGSRQPESTQSRVSRLSSAALCCGSNEPFKPSLLAALLCCCTGCLALLLEFAGVCWGLVERGGRGRGTLWREYEQERVLPHRLAPPY